MTCFSEPTLDEVLSDPLIQDMMASDGIDPQELETELAVLAIDLRRRKPARAGRGDAAVRRERAGAEPCTAL